MSDKTGTFTIRPFSNSKAGSELKGAFRVNLSGPALISLKLRAGDLCQLKNENSPPKTAIAWSAPEKIQDFVVQTSRTLQELYGFKLGDKIVIEKLQKPLTVATQVVLWEVTEGLDALSEESRTYWEGFLQEKMGDIEVWNL